jgi:hypothetical protein
LSSIELIDAAENGGSREPQVKGYFIPSS